MNLKRAEAAFEIDDGQNDNSPFPDSTITATSSDALCISDTVEVMYDTGKVSSEENTEQASTSVQEKQANPGTTGKKLSDKELDLLGAQGLYQLTTDIIKRGKTKYKEGYKKQLLSNKEKAVILSEKIVNDESQDVYDYILNTLGENTLNIRYKEKGAEYYSIFIDNKNQVHIYAATGADQMAFSLYPEVDEQYEMK